MIADGGDGRRRDVDAKEYGGELLIRGNVALRRRSDATAICRQIRAETRFICLFFAGKICKKFKSGIAP